MRGKDKNPLVIYWLRVWFRMGVEKMEKVLNVSKGMVIHGSIETTDDLSIEGVVYGDVNYVKKFVLEGRVEGDIISKGNDESNLKIEKNAVVIGNVQGKQLSIAGATMGDVAADEVLEIASTAIIQGDIAAAKMNVENGAAIEGMMTINPQGMDLSKVFDL